MEKLWWCEKNSKQQGPVSLAELLDLRASDENPLDSLICQAGVFEWRPVTAIESARPEALEAFCGEKPIDPLALPTTSTPAPAAVPNPRESNGHPPEMKSKPAMFMPPKKGNWIVRHWRGDLDLGVSYFVNVILLTFVIVLALGILEPSRWGIAGCDVSPFRVGLYVGSLFCVVLWQVVGIWRSAARHKALTGKTLWPRLAQFSVLVGVFSVVFGIGQEWILQIKNGSQYAAVTNSYQNYDPRVLRDGTEVEISGNFRNGIADDFQKLLAQYPNIKVVHLDSSGGKMWEGQRLAEIFRSHGLKTYVPNQCLSACTFAYLGGHERYLKSGASLGFHQPWMCAVPQSREFNQYIDMYRGYLIDQGVLPDFAKKAMSTPSSGIWYPTQDELISANVVTAVTDGDEFALSGFNWSDHGRDRLEQAFQQDPDDRALKEKLPATYQRYFAIFEEGLSKGQSRGEVLSKARSLYRETIRKQLPYVSDKVALDYTRLLLEELAQLERVSPALCADFVYSPKADTKYWQYLTSETLEQNTQIRADIINSADPKRNLLTDRQVSPLLEKTASIMRKSIGEDADLIKQLRTAEGRAEIGPARTCKATAALYHDVLELPPEQAASALKYLFSTFGAS